jgi:adenylate cyclase class 2
MILAGFRPPVLHGKVKMLEVEMKFPVEDFAAVVSRLGQWGAGELARRTEEDHYFNAPDRDFARTDEALRLRRIGSANLVTYKGPKIDPQTKTRTEIEVQMAHGDATGADFRRLLEHLGYRPVAVVRKERRLLHLHRGSFPVEVCLDEVENVGRFVELEIQAPAERLAEARQALLQTAADLGLERSERRSYLELLLAQSPTRQRGCQ